jgi:hypothetical protein
LLAEQVIRLAHSEEVDPEIGCELPGRRQRIAFHGFAARNRLHHPIPDLLIDRHVAVEVHGQLHSMNSI